MPLCAPDAPVFSVVPSPPAKVIITATGVLCPLCIQRCISGKRVICCPLNRAGGVLKPACKCPAGSRGRRRRLADLSVRRQNRLRHVLNVRSYRTCARCKCDRRAERCDCQSERLRVILFFRPIGVELAVCNGSGQCNSTGCCIRDRQRLAVFAQRDAIVSRSQSMRWSCWRHSPVQPSQGCSDHRTSSA